MSLRPSGLPALPGVGTMAGSCSAMALALLITGRWRRPGDRRRNPTIIAGAIVCFVAFLVRRLWAGGAARRRSAAAAAAAMAAELPPLLVEALRCHDAVAVLGMDFLCASGSPLSVVDLLSQIVADMPQDSSAQSNQYTGKEVYRPKVLSSIACIDDDPTWEAERRLGDVCAAFGVGTVVRAARATCSAAAPPRAMLSRRLDALAAVPFGAVLVGGWCWHDELGVRFPHRIARNFGGFATVLAKTRIDAPKSRARPLMHLWPGLTTKGGRGATTAESLPCTRADCVRELASDGPYATFLRDVFKSKIAVLIGWPELPPAGHIGEALRQAWRETRARDLTRAEPLAYALAPRAPVSLVATCLQDYGLQLLGRGEDDGGATGLGELSFEIYLRWLAESVNSRDRSGGSG